MFFIAGVETTSSTVTFVLHEFSLNEDIQEKARAEIFEIVKEKGLSYDSLKEMNFLEMCILGKYIQKLHHFTKKFTMIIISRLNIF